MDKLQYYKTWANFHRKLLEASNNILLINLYSSISSLLHRYLCIYEYIPGDRKSGAQEHNEIVGDHNKILSLINKGSYDQAEAKMRSHIRKSLRRLKGQVLKRIGR